MSDTGVSIEPAPRPAPLSGDLTRGPITRTLILFSLPVLATTLLQTVNGSINAIWVGRLIGESALAATAIANMIMFLLFTVIYGLGNATTIRVGHFYGGHDLDAARRFFAAGIGFCVLLGIAGGLAGAVSARWMLHLLATPPESMVEAMTYLRVTFLTLPFGVVSMMLAIGLRGAGDSRTPLYGTITTVVLDAALNPLFILGAGPVPALGIAGSALAAALANLLGTVLMIWIVQSRTLPLRLQGGEWRYLVPDRETIVYIVTKGLPMGSQMLAMSMAGLIVIGLVNRQGLNTSAAYGAVLQIWNYVTMPVFAVGMGVSAVVAQSIGAGRTDRIDATTRVGLWIVLVMTVATSALVVLFGRPLLALFLGGDSPALPIGQHILAIATWSFVFLAAVVILSSTMRAHGEVILPLVVMVAALYPGRLGFYYAARPWLGEEAVWWSFPASMVVNIVLTWLAYSRANWRGKANLPSR